MGAVVCFDLTPFSSGSRFRGIGMYAFELAQAMASARHALHGDLDLRLLMGTNSSMRVVPCVPGDFESLHEGRPQGSFLYQASKKVFGRAALRRAKVDLYHAADPKGTPHLGIGRTVVTCHDIIPTLLAGPYLGLEPRWFSRFMDVVRYRLPDHVIAISEATRDDVCRTLGLPQDRVTVVHHGVDHALFNTTAATGERRAVAEAIGTDRPYFLYVGAFDHRKQIPLLVEAFARIAREVDEALVISGRLGPGPARDAIGREVARHGLEDRVRLPGFLPRKLLPALYRSSTAHVLPSIYEGFGMTLVEAMACGCPVVACRVSAMPEICGDAAHWAEPLDRDSLAQALVRVATDATYRAELQRRGIARASHFSWERAAAETFAVYRKVLFD